MSHSREGVIGLGLGGPDLDGFDWSAAAPSIPTDDAAVARRVKAIAATGPIHDLDRNKSSYEGSFWHRYDLLSLAVGAIDQVALAMGVSAGMRFDDALVYLVGQAQRQQPDEVDEVQVAVATRVLDALVTNTPRETEYVDHSADITTRRRHGFRLLYEQWAADDSVHLRASEEAVNVLVDALDLDVTSAQIAAEVQMRVLIERNALAGAVSVARRARYQTVQYLEQVRTVVRDTSIDPDAYDWEKEVPEFLDAALGHVVDRIRVEGELVAAVEERRDQASSAELRRTANQLIGMLRECAARHGDLQRHLMDARAQLRAAQDDRLARPRGSIRRAEIEQDLLVPLLHAPLTAASSVGDRLFGAFAAPRQPFQPSLAILIDELLVPPPPRDEGHVEPDPVFCDEPLPWWSPYWDEAEDLLAAVDEPIRLSDLLIRARAVASATAAADADGEVRLNPDLLAAAVAHLAHGLLGASIADAGDDLLMAVPTSDALADCVVDANDLLIVRAGIERRLHLSLAHVPAAS